MAEDIVKLLSRPGSPIYLFFDSQRRCRIPRQTPSAGAQNIREVGKIYDIRLKSLFMSVPMTSSDPNPGFKVTESLEVEYLETGAS